MDDFKKRFQELSDEDFIRLIASEASNYNQEELEIMKVELLRRNIEYTVTCHEFKTVKEDRREHDTDNMSEGAYIDETNSLIQDNYNQQARGLNPITLIIFIICAFIAMLTFINYTANMIVK